MIFNIPLSARDSKIVFDHLTIKNGLSDGRIDCITQDSFGFLWFGTQDGLNRFDGYNFTVFDHDIFDSTSISSNWIRCITKDKKGNLWIGTEGGGLNLFNYEMGQFTCWDNEPGNSESLNDNFVRAIIEDSYSVLWIGTRSGLVQFDRKKNIFTPFHFEPFNANSPIFNENVTSLIEDSDRNLWIGTQDGIYRYNRQNQTIEHLTFSSEADRIVTIFEDSYGDVWIGSRYNGIRVFDRKIQTFIQYQNQADDLTSLSSNEIKDIFQDNDKNLWIATIQGGLNLFDRKTGRFQHYNNDPNDPSSLSSNSVRTIYQDQTGVMWIGMDGSGIDSFVKNQQKFQLYDNRIGNLYNLSNNTILAIFEDADGTLWLGTEGGGLNKFNRKRGICTHYITEKDNPNSISSDQVTCVYEDREGILWIGTKEGLNKFDRQHQSFERFYNKDTPITANNFINVIIEDRDGNLMLGTNNGVEKFDRQTGEFSYLDYDKSGILNNEVVLTLLTDRSELFWIGYLRSGLVAYNQVSREYILYRSDPEKSNSLSSNFVQYLYQDGHDYLWIATRKGLNKFDRLTSGFIQYTKTEGLPSNVIVGILEDDDGNLWLSMTNGLSKFNPKEETFTNYNIDDGLQGNQFWIKSCFKSRSGELFFGGNNGFNSFYPERLEELSNPNIPPIVITNVMVLEKPYLRSVTANLSEKNTLRLSYKENRISFEFAALDFTRPGKNQFAYMLGGFDQDWISSGTRRYANYTNLHPGYYVFRVKGANNDGVWNEVGTSLSFFIRTPFWKTGWAYLLYITLAIGIIYGINIYALNLVRARHDLKIERMEKEKVKEINRFKLQFFTDVAHEFKAPLTLIQAPLEEILHSGKKNLPFKNEFRLMHRNVKYLSRLVYQLLSFRRAEQKRMKLKASQGDLVLFVRELFDLFSDTAQKHNIDYRFNTQSTPIEGWFDWGKLEEIMVNIIDNAFKYTPDNGQISVNLALLDNKPEDGSDVQISVEDTGIGISEANLLHIFERFYHASGGSHSSQLSSGLGLALAKRLIELHHGEITVDSTEGKGSRFKIKLPLGRSHLNNDEIITDISETPHFHRLMDSTDEYLIYTEDQSSTVIDKKSGSDQALILIVEDDNELRAYLRKSLTKRYRIAEAKDGKEGLEKANKLLPGIIISDVVMPNLDGIEMCRQLKENITTSHIPIILLTARSAIESKIEGIETGADDYIEKPFHFRFLDVRIKNILKSREKLRERYRKELILEPEEISVTSTDEKFLIKIRSVVEERLSNPDLEIRHLSSEAGLSRTNLFMKLKALTGYSPNEFIKTIRLEKASQFLRKTDMTISEIAYEVGFKYPKYFSTCYSRQFGMTPSEYRQQNRPAA
ncbi:MAG: response regulator [candidate division Zixibacteria bacterium]|nr:response regulator [candidate division Zixibacteria bacterium]